MTARKLQSEIERTIKKVNEGVDNFETTFEKISQTTNQAQKDKLELDLKKEIKKLQRFRDQIKNWLSSSDVKDKKQLLDNRKIIESQMEKFKQCEKELKTKAFSKEGLLATAKVDPQEKEKMEYTTWVTDTMDKLNTQIDIFESEQEILNKKKKKNENEKALLAKFDHSIARHKTHITKLEIILRMLENGALTLERVKEIKEDVNYYVDSNQEDEFEEDEGIYEELNLDEAEGFGFANDDDDDNNSDFDGSADGSHEKIDFSSPPSSARQSLEKSSKHNSITSSSESIASPSKKGNKIMDRAAKASPIIPRIKPSPARPISANLSGSSALSPPSLVGNVTPNLNRPRYSVEQSDAPPPINTLPLKYAAAAASITAEEKRASPLAVAPPPTNKPPTPVANLEVVPPVKSPITAPVPVPVLPTTLPVETNVPVPNTVESNIDNRLPISVSDLVSSFEATKERAGNGNNMDQLNFISQMLDTSAQFVPDVLDSERPKYHFPKLPFPTPSYYPQTPHAVFENQAIYEKFDTDTLFFIFYYQQGTYQQYLAARELKRQSWRFHKKYLTWFQRHEEPKSITDEYEQGTYVYFDYEESWCQRKKGEFRFEYRFLEDEVV